jgi:hypothetical protein
VQAINKRSGRSHSEKENPGMLAGRHWQLGRSRSRTQSRGACLTRDSLDDIKMEEEHVRTERV